MRIKVIHFGAIMAALLASACFVPSLSSADPVQNRSMTPAARQARRASDDVFLSPIGIVPPERKVTGVLFHRASSEPADKQIEEARIHEEMEDWKGAIGIYDRLVRSCPYSLEAAEAQLRLARLQEKRGKYKDAFEEYRYLLYYYPENAPADAILKQMFAIAAFYEQRGDAGTAIDLFRKITDIAPKWKHTAQALLHLGMMEAQKKKYLDAAEIFDSVMTGYPRTAVASKASGQHASVLYSLARKYPEDDATQLRAISSARTALVLMDRDAPERRKVSGWLDELTSRRYDRHYRMATFYDSSRYSVETKIAAYKDFLRCFPQAPQAEMARARLAELQAPGGRSS